MGTIRTDVGSPTRIEYGTELSVGLQAFPETTPLAPEVDAITQELEEAHEQRRKQGKRRVRTRARLRIVGYQVDQVIRRVARQTELADGGRRGPLFSSHFPAGLSPVIAPTGTRQLKPLQELHDRAQACRLPGAAELFAQIGPELKAALEQLTQAINEHLATHQAHASALTEELALREEHALTVDKIIGLVRAAFPRDRARQTAIFPETTRRTARTTPLAEPEEEVDGGAEPEDE